MSGPKRSFHPIDIARRGAKKLAKLTQADGSFVHRYKHPGGERDDDYNLLRHCGSIWSMADIAFASGPLPEVRAAADRAVDWLLARHIAPIGDNLCVIEDGDAKLGGAGLGILALLEVTRWRKSPELFDAARGLAGFIISQRRDNGDFHHKIGVADGEVRNFYSDYYTGEALFGLARLSEATNESSWLDAALACARLLSDEEYGVKTQSHWMMYALARMYALTQEPWLHSYAAKIARRIVDDPGYRGRRQSTPVACRSEALAAFLKMGPGPAIVADEALQADALRTLQDNLFLQARWFKPNGAFLEGDLSPWVQIDYIQHNITSFHAFHLLYHAG